MLSRYDVRHTCRTCLLKSDELVSLDESSATYVSTSSECISHETTGELLMELANIQVNFDSVSYREIFFIEN